MGLEYRLFKEKPFKQSFDLSKGIWNKLNDHLPYEEKFLLNFYFNDLIRLSNFIQDNVYWGGMDNHDHKGKYDCDNCKPYFDELANRLLIWCGEEEIWLSNDSEDDFYDLANQYPITEDRFIPRLF